MTALGGDDTVREQARIPGLRVVVSVDANPFLLRPAIEAALAGRPWIAGAEADVAQVVARAVRRSQP